MDDFKQVKTLRQARLTQAVSGLAIGLWVTLAIVITVKTVQHPENHSTYPLFFKAARAWWQGESIYENLAVGDYRYGPSFVMALGPVAWMPYVVGAVVWALFNVALAFWATWALARRVLPGMQSELARNLVLAVSVFPSAHCLYSSQTNLLIFAFVAFAAISMLDQRWWLAAFLLAIPVHIKIWPLAGGLLLAACRPRKLAWRLPLGLAAVAAAPLLVKPWATVYEQYIQWFQHLLGPAQIRHSYRDAWTIWEQISRPVDPLAYAVLQLATAVGLFGLCFWQARRTTPQRSVMLALVCWTSWQLVFGPGTERNTFALIAPLTGWGIVVAFLEKSGSWLVGLGFLMTVVSALGGGIEDMHPWLLCLHPVGILLFFAWFLTWYFRTKATNLECGNSLPLSKAAA